MYVHYFFTRFCLERIYRVKQNLAVEKLIHFLFQPTFTQEATGLATASLVQRELG